MTLYAGRHRTSASSPQGRRDHGRGARGRGPARRLLRTPGPRALGAAAAVAVVAVGAFDVATGGVGSTLSAARADGMPALSGNAALQAVAYHADRADLRDQRATAGAVVNVRATAARDAAAAAAAQAAAEAAALQAQRQAEADRAARDAQRQSLIDGARQDPRGAARAMFAEFGFADSQFGCLDRLWTRESGWSFTATNASSGAYGIPQSLPASKMASAGADYRSNPVTQIRWGLGYIKASYGTPCGAWAQSQASGWY